MKHKNKGQTSAHAMNEIIQAKVFRTRMRLLYNAIPTKHLHLLSKQLEALNIIL